MTNAGRFTDRMFEPINSMLLDVLAAVARKNCDDRDNHRILEHAARHKIGPPLRTARSFGRSPRPRKLHQGDAMQPPYCASEQRHAIALLYCANST